MWAGEAVGGSGLQAQRQARAFTGSPTEHVRASLPSAWAACLPKSVRVRVRRTEPREAGQVRAGHKARGRAQQVCAAGAQQARAVPGQDGSTPVRAAPALGDLRVSGRLNWPSFKASAQLSNPPKSTAARSGVLPVLPTAQRAPAARLPHTPAARATAHCCARRTPRQCSRLPSPHAHAHRSQACRASPCTGQGCSYVLPQRPREGAPCHRSRLPRPPAASPPRI